MNPRTLSDRALQKLAELFAEPQTRARAEASLVSYLAEPSGHSPERVALAILKLSEGDLSALLTAIESARQDPRDVLAWAEYPAEMGLDAAASTQERQDARRRDKEQYSRWLGARKP